MKKISLTKILNSISSPYVLEGNKKIKNISSLASINLATKNDITFIDHNRNDKQDLLNKTKAGVIICDHSLLISKDSVNLIIKVKLPKYVFSEIFSVFKDLNDVYDIDKSTKIHSEAILSNKILIGSHSHIGKAKIGQGSVIGSNVTIHDNVFIGKNVQIDSGTVIGSDGFGYNRNESGILLRFPHIGGVEINDNVEIGANSCIDNGTLTKTIIGKGTKIDNNVHIGHGVEIGKNVLIGAMTSIAGSTKVGDFAEIWTGVNISPQLKIGKNSFIGIGSVVISDIPENKKCFGNPARVFSKK